MIGRSSKRTLAEVAYEKIKEAIAVADHAMYENKAEIKENFERRKI